ncbi:MAG: sugar phosphate isomerase/epimerase family protein, partial [Planctomycetota bacterium]
MGKVNIGLNTEFSRSSDKPFEWAVEKTAEMGYKYIEPMIHLGRELMSEAGYFHTVSMFDDPYRIKDASDKAGLTISGLQSHGPLGRPEVHGEYIKMAIRVAAEIGVPVINTDEGIKAKWTTEEEDFVLIKYTLQEAAFVAERRGVKIGLEPHAQYSKTPDGLDRIYNL